MNLTKACAFLSFLSASTKQVAGQDLPAKLRTRKMAAEKRDVCHWSEDEGVWFKINIAEKAFQSHLDHGDAAPGDPVPGKGNEGKTFGDDCVPEDQGVTCNFACCSTSFLQDPPPCQSVTETGCSTCGKGACAGAASSYCLNLDGFNLILPSFSAGETCAVRCGGRRERNRLLADASYSPSPEEAFEIAQETGGDVNAGFVLKEKILTSDECAKLMVYIDENDGVHYRSNDDDKVIMARRESPLESIIGIERTKELYTFFKDNTDGAPITQVWLRRINGHDTFMGLHTDEMPYQMKIVLNDNFDEGDVLVVDRDGATRLQLEAGDAYIHDNRLVHGHMPFTGAKYIIYLISDPTPLVDLAQAALAH